MAENFRKRFIISQYSLLKCYSNGVPIVLHQNKVLKKVQLYQAVKSSKDKKKKKNEAILAKKMNKNENLQRKNEKNDKITLCYAIQFMSFLFFTQYKTV